MTVADEPVQAKLSSSAVEQGVGVHGEKQGNYLFVRETVQPRSARPKEGTFMSLWIKEYKVLLYLEN